MYIINLGGEPGWRNSVSNKKGPVDKERPFYGHSEKCWYTSGSTIHLIVPEGTLLEVSNRWLCGAPFYVVPPRIDFFIFKRYTLGCPKFDLHFLIFSLKGNFVPFGKIMDLAKDLAWQKICRGRSTNLKIEKSGFFAFSLLTPHILSHFPIPSERIKLQPQISIRY